MLYMLNESTDGVPYGLLSATSKISQEDIDDAIKRMQDAEMWDWNIDDLCDELEKVGIDAAPAEINGELWI